MSAIDYDILFKLRLAVARKGEMDCNEWWNTNGLLGSNGRHLLLRGFPKTYSFAQARAVFNVAQHRCDERFPAVPGCMTLWRLPTKIEDRFDSHWAYWIDNREKWLDFFESIESGDFDLADMVKKMSPQGVDLDLTSNNNSISERAFSLRGFWFPSTEIFCSLALAFSLSEGTKLKVPYARIKDDIDACQS